MMNRVETRTSPSPLARAVRALGFSVMLAVLPGCVKLSRPYPEKRFHVLEAERPAGRSAPEARLPGSVAVKAFSSSAGAAEPGFLYRTGPHRVERDFYNEFFAPPASLATEAAARWIAAAGIFEHASPPDAAAAPRWLLEGSLARLEADYSVSPPLARLEIQVLLSEEGERGWAIRLQRDYAAAEPLAEEDPGACAAAWNRGLTQILGALEADLRAFAAERKAAGADSAPDPAKE